MQPNKLVAAGAAPGAPERVAPVLSSAQLLTQAARLAQAVPRLGAAYVRAVGRWQGDPVLRLAGRPIITECFRSVKRQDELYAQGRTAPGDIVTYKRGGESNHNVLPSVALDVAFVLPGGEVSWSGLLLSKFARLMKAAEARVHWGGDWPHFKDRPHFEV